jgi:hypothetical protein
MGITMAPGYWIPSVKEENYWESAATGANGSRQLHLSYHNTPVGNIPLDRT